MRAILCSAAAALLFFLVLYLGLNLVEENMEQLMGLETSKAVFTIQRLEGGMLEITFCGHVLEWNADRVLVWLRKISGFLGWV